MPRRPRDPARQAALEAVDQAMEALAVARRLLSGSTRPPRRAAAFDDAFERAHHEGVPVAAPSLRHAGLTVRQAAGLLGVGEEQVRRLLRRGELLGVPFGGRTGWRLSRDYVERLAAGRARRP